MPQEPKKRHSRARQGKRRAAIHLTQKNTIKCTNCGTLNPAHTICRNCGYYKGRLVIDKKVNRKKEANETKELSTSETETK